MMLKILTLRGSGLLSIGKCICWDAWTYGPCSDPHARNQLLVTLNIRCYGCSKYETNKNLRSNLTEKNTDFVISGLCLHNTSSVFACQCAVKYGLLGQRNKKEHFI